MSLYTASLPEGEWRDVEAAHAYAQLSTSTIVCRYFMAGSCRFGASCRYSHPREFQERIVRDEEKEEEIWERHKLIDNDRIYDGGQRQICQYFVAGSCRFGKVCKAIHLSHYEQSRLVETSANTTAPVCECVSGCPRVVTKKESLRAAPDLLATILGISPAVAIHRLSKNTAFARMSSDKNRLPIYLSFPISKTVFSLIVCKSTREMVSKETDSQCAVGMPPYMTAAASTHARFTRRVALRVYGSLFHGPCILNWLERALGVVFLTLPQSQACLYARTRESWGFNGYIAPFGSRIRCLTKRENKEVSTSRLASASLPKTSDPTWRLSKDEKKHIENFIFSSSQRDAENYDEDDGNCKLTHSANIWKGERLFQSQIEKEGKLNVEVPLRKENCFNGTHPCVKCTGYCMAFLADEKISCLEFLQGETLKEGDGPKIFWTRFLPLGPESDLDVDMTPAFTKILRSESAGCNASSQLSEALSADVLSRMLGFAVTHTEMEIKYRSRCPRLDFRCAMEKGGEGGVNEKRKMLSEGIGISVTRAVPFRAWKDGSSFSRMDARKLLIRKIKAIITAKGAVETSMGFDRSLLHVWCANEELAQMVFSEAGNIYSNKESIWGQDVEIFFQKLAILITITDFDVPIEKLRYTYLYSGGS
mmetsp:Transcript_23822/g.33362  ORF Transcript_23822/g.33362 Transcript_23822/m.33362 type:complete len:649 (-) Transcript_23822:59-2005(-)|eukprot:CAMPEP_0184494644 /NCGR_PEP_ID=MMETSP0113_2-20130426/29257_1 /TAXON_ID=91329 /ORGANISM="Norrisiella sphaerica, Strain BC52" /LENGTH=648 /DNA_ID=CAMNT_0026880489 /DNA_START=335 /DNA_END=2281 /DNA_ORIENTATION=-